MVAPAQGVGLWVWLISGICILLGGLFRNQNLFDAIDYGVIWGFYCAGLYWLSPAILFLLWPLKERRLPNRQLLNRFSTSQKLITAIVLAFWLVFAFDQLAPKVFSWWQTHSLTGNAISHHVKPKYLKHFDTIHFLIIWFFTALALIAAFGIWLKMPASTKPQKLKKQKGNFLSKKITSSSAFRLWIGESTGWLSSLHHSVGIMPKQAVTLTLEDAAQNIIALGAIGSGKTTRVIHPLLFQLLDQDCGGLIFDIKGDFKKAVHSLSETLKKEFITIGPNQKPLDLLAGLTPEIAASFLKSALILGNNNSLDSFWIDTAAELCRNSLGVLSLFPEHYNLQGLYRYLFQNEFRKDLDLETITLISLLDDKKKRLLQSYRE